MIFRQLFEARSSTYTYLIGDSDTRHPSPLVNQASRHVIAPGNVLNLRARRKRLAQNLKPLLIRPIPAATRPSQYRHLRHGCP